MKKPEKTLSNSAKVNTAGSEQMDNKRRNFLIGAGVGSVGAAAALVATGTGIQPEAKAVTAPVSEGEGYRETEHIRRYYGTTRI